MDWIQSAKLLPFDYVVTLWLPANASKGDPFEFPALSVIEVFVAPKEVTIKELALLKYQRCAPPGD